MLVGIIAANNLRFSPYAFFYTKLLDDLGINYELVVPNRNPDIEDKFDGKVNILEWKQGRHNLINYLQYSREVKKLARKKYDYLIVLTTINAVFSCSWLKRYYAGNYLVDIRDYTYENNLFYYFLEKRAIENAELNVISSAKFQTFLPKNDYLVCHNINTPKTLSSFSLKKTIGRIVIGYIGAVSYEQQCKKLIDLVNLDDRFEFHIYGTGVAEKSLHLYTEALNNERIKMFGSYEPIEKEEIVKKVDILFNAYGNGRPLLDYALSNKLYEAMYYHKPLLTSPNTYMTELGGKMVFAIDFNKVGNLDALWDWYEKIDKDEIDEYAVNLYNKVLDESHCAEEHIKIVLKNHI